MQAEFLFKTDKIRLNDKIIMDILSDDNVILKSKFKWYGDSGFRENRVDLDVLSKDAIFAVKLCLSYTFFL